MKTNKIERTLNTVELNKFQTKNRFANDYSLKILFHIRDQIHEMKENICISCGFEHPTKSHSRIVYCRLTYLGKRHEFSTFQKDYNKSWNQKLRMFEDPLDEAKNATLRHLRYRIETYFAECRMTGRAIDMVNIKKAVMMESYIEEEAEQRKISYLFTENLKYQAQRYELKEFVALRTMQKWTHATNLFKDFFAQKYGLNGRTSQIMAQDAKELFLYLKSRHQSTNSATKYIQLCSSVFKYGMDTELLLKNPFANFRQKKEKKEIIALSETELSVLTKHHFESRTLERVRDVFVFQCLTGLAYCDVLNLRKHHILKDENTGEYYIKKEREKTKNASIIPLYPQAIDLMNKYKDDNHCLKNSLILPVMSNQKMNTYLKQIGHITNIEKPFTTHIARKTYATILVNRGVLLSIVSKALGHSSTLMTETYYAKTNEETIIREIFSKQPIRKAV